MLKASLFSQLVLFGSILTYSKFEPVSFGSTANPVLLLLIIFLLIVFTNRVPKICIEILQRALLYLPISAIFVCLFVSNSNLSFDIRFLATSLAFFFFSVCFIGFGVFLSSLRNTNVQLFINILDNLLNSLIILLFLIIPLNLLSLQCVFFKCRKMSGSVGFSLLNSEPSYVGIFLFSILTFSFYLLNDFHLRSNLRLVFKSKLLIFTSIILLIFSKSALALISVVLYALFVWLLIKIAQLFNSYKLLVPTRFSQIQILAGLFVLTAPIYVIFYTKIGSELFLLIGQSNYVPIYLSQNNLIETIVFLGGNRFSYLFSLVYVDPPLLLSGHSLFASSEIFEKGVSFLFENIGNFGFFSVYGAKPHSALGQLIFTFGALGSLFIYYPVFRLFLRRLSIITFSKASYFQLWILFSPLFAVLYFTPNTDPWKFCTLMIFVAFTYSYDKPYDTSTSRFISA